MFGLCTVNWILWKFSLLFVYLFSMEYWFVLSIQLDSIEIILHHFYFISFCVVCSPSNHPISLCLIISFAPHMYTFLNISFYMNLTKKKTKKSSTNQYVCVLYIVFNVFVCLYSYLYIRTVYVYVSRVIFLFRCVC